MSSMNLPLRHLSQRHRLRVRVVPGRQLTPELCARWDEILRSNPALSSPYFRPEFTQAVSAVRTDVEVAVIEGEDGIEAFFPYQRGSFSAATPVAGRLSDFHGLIAEPAFTCDPRALLRQCGLRSWSFDHLLAAQNSFQPFVFKQAVSPYLDLSRGFDVYEVERRAQTSELATTKRKLGKLGREIGPVRLEWRSTDRLALQKLLSWKSDQYIRTGCCDLFTFEWIRRLFDQLLERDNIELSGILSCLYAGDRLVAAHLGMTSQHVLHWWFPSFDQELGKYSPGLGLMYLMAQQANEQGITRIDLGKGDEEYKFKFASGFEPVAEGCVDLRVGSQFLRRTWQATRDLVKSSPLYGSAQVPRRWIRQMSDWLSFR